MSRPAPEHRRPEGVTDETVEAVGKLSAALDHVEDARGHLYAFHRLMGSAESTMEEAEALMREAGHTDLADAMDRDVLGGNPLPGMWSFQMVEEYDDGFYARAKGLHQRALDELMDGQRHVFEAEMKELRRTRGRDGPRGPARRRRGRPGVRRLAPRGRSFVVGTGPDESFPDHRSSPRRARHRRLQRHRRGHRTTGGRAGGPRRPARPRARLPRTGRRRLRVAGRRLHPGRARPTWPTTRRWPPRSPPPSPGTAGSTWSWAARASSPTAASPTSRSTSSTAWSPRTCSARSTSPATPSRCCAGRATAPGRAAWCSSAR